MIKLTDPSIQKYLTPFKYPEPVLEGSGVEGAFDEKSVDIPFVFRHNGKWYMMYTGYDGKGYQSALATSDDLLHWEHKGIMIPRDDESSTAWDKVGCAITWLIKKSNNFEDTPELLKYDGKYWAVYHSYPSVGYEAGPAEIGLAWCDDEELLTWHRFDKSILSPHDGNDWERGGLYKACIIRHDEKWYMFYNAKDTSKRWIEQTGVAVSDDLMNWTRPVAEPILKVGENTWDARFVSDPYILKDGDKWLNFYFGYDRGHAMEGLAVSDDLMNWEKVEEPIIASTPGGLDEEHAHKAAIVYYDGVLYHFYCATRPNREGDKTSVFNAFRTIAVATSKKVW